MCGIVGLIAKNESGQRWMQHLHPATQSLLLRGPDAQNFFEEEHIGFGHCRLSIIDLSETANQPMFDESKRYVIIYNGEIFNFKPLRKNLEEEGISFVTNSDTEVLLQLYIRYKAGMLELLNGFFAFAIYDREKQSVFIARDRFGVKPLFFYEDENVLAFASEMKALMRFPIKKEMDYTSLYEYLQLNYITGPQTIYQSVKKLLPGHYLWIENGETKNNQWYELEAQIRQLPEILNYEDAQKKLFELMDDAVRIRLIADVPLGSFLSGGIDSSIVSGLASLHTDQLKTFSIGYSDDGFFDETDYARLVAKHFKTDHTVFSLSRNDLLESLDDVLNYFDEPFADSSALPVYILSKHTRKHVKVALSGDGSDEIFGGYIKHTGDYRARHPRFPELMGSYFSPVLNFFPTSRNNFLGNKIRQAQKFYEGIKLNDRDRYWRWCSISDEEQARQLLIEQVNQSEFMDRKNKLTFFSNLIKNLNGVLLNDVKMVLPDDMLMKVDSMSMANSLEVRTPFLDYRVVEFAFSFPPSFKVDRSQRKKIVHDTFKNFLPKELYHRPKRGFEIPLHSFLIRELKSLVEQNLSEKFIREQNIFSEVAVKNLRSQLFSTNPADSAARIWGLLVFQHWWKRWKQ
ncbi:MAG TPA: asparagine synthase (glutamine-hydrolyzing) [Chitinophagales bacterium]|nr:asparagine synthase (glutamine-hydrolyzing) [Chitinophagales bacterium]